MNNKNIISLVGLNTILGIERVKSLNFSNNELEYIEEGVFGNLQELTYLNLSDNQLAREGVVEQIRNSLRPTVTLTIDNQTLPLLTGFHTKAALREPRPLSLREDALNVESTAQEVNTNQEDTMCKENN